MSPEQAPVVESPQAAAGGAATTPPTPPSSPPALSPRELARWAWRQLTSMRTALVLLFLLALGAIPGSIVPQRDVDSLAAARWVDQHPTLAPIYDKLGLFSVFDSVWFSAIYILLMISLVGCIVPRLRIYWRGMRARPPKAPRNLSRLPESRTFEVDAAPAEALERARAVLARKRYRVDVHPDSEGDTGGGAVAGERGFLREAGNLLFHVSLLVVLVGFAFGNLYGYKGGVIVVSGQSFSNSLSQYDDFLPGALFGADDLEPFSFTVDDFHVDFLQSGEQAGMPTDFAADLTYRETPDAPARTYELAVNHPLQVDGGSVFLVGHGYAPKVTVRDGEGNVAYKGPVVFLPEDSTFKSFGVIKVPDAMPEQLGFEGLFLPTYGFSMERGPFSQFPDALDPVLSILPYHGDLGLDSGKPQSVYELKKDDLDVFTKDNGNDYRLDIAVGQTKQLPGGAGSITFDGVDRWVKLQVSESPGKKIALAGVVLALLGLLGSLFIRPRRTWVRVTRREGRTVVELAGLDRSSGGDLRDEINELEKRLQDSEAAKRETT
ncbi:MAG TPA: cytochrome c biogenesis protein ResB [Nocardioidaceae bacterium]|nr:cytochrome c biogenesis protein ResB [Nocardioidaceae bacterium]